MDCSEGMGHCAYVGALVWLIYFCCWRHSLVASQRDLATDGHFNLCTNCQFNGVDLASYGTSNYKDSKTEMVNALFLDSVRCKDYLGSAPVVTDANENTVDKQRYYPYGETRLSTEVSIPISCLPVNARWRAWAFITIRRVFIRLVP